MRRRLDVRSGERPVAVHDPPPAAKPGVGLGRIPPRQHGFWLPFHLAITNQIESENGNLAETLGLGAHHLVARIGDRIWRSGQARQHLLHRVDAVDPRPLEWIEIRDLWCIEFEVTLRIAADPPIEGAALERDELVEQGRRWCLPDRPRIRRDRGEQRDDDG